jgi:hypothetical protein
MNSLKTYSHSHQQFDNNFWVLALSNIDCNGLVVNLNSKSYGDKHQHVHTFLVHIGANG